MIYIALLRGINVGGNNKISMAELKTVFEQAGMTSVTTYINSGNVVFKSEVASKTELAQILEKAIETTFGFSVKVLVWDKGSLLSLAKGLPDSWANDKTMKCGDKVTKSGLLKIIGTTLYRHMTVRNCNTLRKLVTIVESKV